MNSFKKVLFLDIDGVLNSTRSMVAYSLLFKKHAEVKYEFDPVSVLLLKRVVQETGCSIVISSAWRITYSLEDLRIIFRDHCDWEDIGEIIIGMTGTSANAHRGGEIQEWIDDNTVGVTNFKYAIVDDNSDMLNHQFKRFVKTDCNVGLDVKSYEKLLELLK